MNANNLKASKLPITEFAPSADKVIWDVRDPIAYQEGHIAHAINIPLDSIDRALVDGVDDTIYVLCGGGSKAGRAAAQILALDPSKDVVQLTGGTRGAIAAGWQLETGV